MAKAVVSVADAYARNLPKVSVKSGEPAGGYASVAISNRRIHLPLAQGAFDRVADLPGIAVEGPNVRLARLHAGFVAALASSDS